MWLNISDDYEGSDDIGGGDLNKVRVVTAGKTNRSQITKGFKL